MLMKEGIARTIVLITSERNHQEIEATVLHSDSLFSELLLLLPSHPPIHRSIEV